MYRVQLQRALLNARISASKSSPEAFFKSLDDLTRLEAARFERQPVGHDYLQQLLSTKSLPIEQEILWIAARIQHESETISKFLRISQGVETAVVQGDYREGLRRVVTCENDLGVSLWSTELKIALTQSASGTEAQKSILKQIRAIRRVGMWPFVANSASTRAEPTVSISWFLAETRRRHDRIKQNEFSDYAHFRALGEWPDTSAGVARILRTEQSHHIIDLYETFISCLQHIITQKPSSQLFQAIVKCLNKIASIQDFRIRKLEFAATGNISPDIPTTQLTLLDALVGDVPLAVLKTLQSGAYRNHLGPDSALALALSACRTTLIGEDTENLKIVAVRGLAQALRHRGHQAEFKGRASEMCRKFFHMYRPLPFAKALRSILGAAIQPKTRLAAREMQLAALNSNAWGFLDLLGFAQHQAFDKLSALFPECSAVAFANVFAGRNEAASPALRPDAHALARSASLMLRARPDATAQAVAAALDSSNPVIATQAATIALNAYARTGETELASALIAREHVERGADPEALPVRDVYQDLEWEQMESAAHRPELSIALSLIQSADGDDQLRTYRRFALETLLMSVGASKPSELKAISTKWNQSILVHLLDKVCTPPMLDMLPAIRSTREVLEERREICGYLATLDKERSERHRLEVLEISRDLTVLDGLRTIDGSRVHVDKESLTRRLKAELAESYQRFVSLVKEEGPQTEGFSNVLKDISLGDRAPVYLYEMPVSEPDELLVSMILRCREQFLFNVPHGLDSYISKRIRHGSIVGVVRAPAERDGIVAKRNLDGSYRPLGTWADKVSDPGQRAALSAAISITSKSIDQYLIRLKDTLLHVKSTEKPYGLLDAPLTPPGYLLIRSVAQEDTSLDSFIDTMFSALWGMLGSSLLQVHALLTKESIPFVSDQVQGLRAKAQRILSSPDERAAFDSAAGSASVGMQSALAIAANWFEPIESASRSYSLAELVEIALASVRATTTSFSPKMHVDGNSTYSFSAMVLPLLCDVFYIAFGNVASHASTTCNPEIWVEVDRDPTQPLLSFKIENSLDDLTPEALEDLRAKLNLIRSDIAAHQGATRVRSEGGSGLHKLANMVTQSDGGTLEFAINGDRFQLHARLRYSPEDIC